MLEAGRAREPRPQYVRGAGLLLAYEVLEPSAGAPARAPAALLCLHGNSSHRGIWRPVAEGLADYRGILLDLRGHGDSEWAVPPAYNPEHHAGDLEGVVPQLQLDRYALLAHSAGDLAAAWFIGTIVPRGLVPPPAAFVWVDIDPLVPRFQVEYFRQRAASVGRVFPTIEEVLAGFQRMYPQIPEPRLRAFISEGVRAVDDGYRMKLDPATYATWEPGDLRPVLPRVTCPTLVLRGAESLVNTREGLTALRQGLPRAEIVEVPGSHMLLLEDPERVAEVIQGFLARYLPSA